MYMYIFFFSCRYHIIFLAVTVPSTAPTADYISRQNFKTFSSFAQNSRYNLLSRPVHVRMNFKDETRRKK